MNPQLRSCSLTILMAVSLWCTGGLAASSAQNVEKSRIVVTKPWPVEPVKVTGVKTKNKIEIELDKSFEDEDDWLDGLSLSVSNEHDKAVIALNISLVFRRESGDKRPPFAWNLRLSPNRVITPGETLELQLTSQNYESIQRAFALTGYTSSVTRVEVVVKEVKFDDGRTLYSGNWLRTN